MASRSGKRTRSDAAEPAAAAPISLASSSGDEGDAVADDARAGAGTAAEAPQLFLQAFLGQGAMRRAAAAELVQRINVRCGIAGMPLQTYIDDANRKLEAANLFLSLKRAWSEVDGIEHVVLCNGKDTDASLSKFAMPNTKTELELLERILGAICTSPKGWARLDSREHGVYHRNVIKSVPQDRVARLLEEWKNAKLLEGDDLNHVFLGVRAVAELSSYLKTTYDMPDCFVCKSWCALRETCAGCKTTLHVRCASAFFQNRAHPKCPSCSRAWPRNAEDEDKEGVGDKDNHDDVLIDE